MRALDVIETGLARLQWLAAAAKFELAMRRHDYALKYGYDPNQLRDERGRWADAGGSGLTRVAGGSSVGRGRGPLGTEFPGATYGQQARLAAAMSRTEAALVKIREYDPNWQPKTESLRAPGSIEGAISEAQARTVEAEARLEQLRSGIGGNFPPRDESSSSPSRAFDGPGWINAYRTINNSPDLFGRPTWPSDRGTVAVTQVDGSLVFGVNSTETPLYSAADRNDADGRRWNLINSYPEVMETANIGGIPNNSLYHAEATVLIRAARESGGALAGRTIEVHVDREMCDSCEQVLPYLGLSVGNPVVTFVDRSGGRRTMWNGSWLAK
jgi:hypothetical protein